MHCVPRDGFAELSSDWLSPRIQKRFLRASLYVVDFRRILPELQYCDKIVGLIGLLVILSTSCHQ
jgi:hypothetical protein